MNGTTKSNGMAYEWVRGRDDMNKARISYILTEQLKGHYPTADEIIKEVWSERAFGAVGEMLFEGFKNGTLKREGNGFYINEEMLPEVKAALGIG